MQVSESEDIIRNFIVDELDDDDTPISIETHLFETGLVDSMNLVRLLAFLEEKFAVQIPVSTVNDQNFATIAAIGGLVDSIRNHGP
jgi:acyl carrier protein